MHEHYVRGFDRRVAAHAAHGYADIRTHEDGRVVDAVAHKTERLGRLFFGEQFFHRRDLVLRQERGGVIGDADRVRHALCGGGAVSRQHDRAAAELIEFGDDLR